MTPEEKKAAKEKAKEKAAAKAAAAAAAEEKGAAKKKATANGVKGSADENVVEEDPGREAREYVNPTPKGELKSMDAPMQRAYQPHEVEASWNDWWEASGYYKGNSSPDDKRPKFSICLPPPNVTGSLHIGHALTVAVQDLLSRWHRMRGFNVLWIPGTDHAGIATQVVVEKKLAKEHKLSRHDIGREEFLKKVFEYKDQFHARITTQLRRLGCSLDWSREVFTMDEMRAASVNAAFVRFYEDKLIYRDVRLTNWCCALRSGISDIEVDYIDIETRTRIAVPGHPKDKTYVFGVIWSFAYKLEGSSDEEIVVATTRPETMLGDVAVAVHPDDPRYKHLHGRHFVHPFVEGRKLKLITDATLVDMNFGTGAVKITPAHDPNDFAAGRRHGLPEITVFTEEGKMADNCGQFSGMMRFEARVEVVTALKKLGLYRGEAENRMRLGRCSRTNDVIEPMLKPQWWVDCSRMAKRAADAVRHGELKIIPEEHNKTWFRWLDNIRDWCVSRQLWWGHRIPAYYVKVRGESVGEVVAASREAAMDKAVSHFSASEAEIELTQDEDVLDTWFSSGLFPFSPLGWPDESNPDYMAWHPTTLLETGLDILFFWVARMMMLGLELTGEAPFHTIYLHGLVRDAQGQKMSKTKGNVVDPIETIEAMGTDALRLSLVTGVTPGQDVPLSLEKVQANRNFANKLWNTARFILIGLDDMPADAKKALAVTSAIDKDELSTMPLPERWVVSRCHALVDEVTSQLKSYDFGPAGQAIYAFLWDEYADWYIEISKRRIASGDVEAAQRSRRVLVYVLDTCLRLLHPYMPYITEELWQKLPHEGEALMISNWPQAEGDVLASDSQAEKQFESIQALVRSVRNARAEYRVEGFKKVAATVFADAALADAISAEADAVSTLGRIDPAEFKVVEAGQEASETAKAEAGNAVRLVVEDGLEALLPMAALVDAEKERARLTKQEKTLVAAIEKLETRLNSPGFADKAPAAVVAKAEGELREQQEQLLAVRDSLKALP
mmetsp:Transcript_50255/g.108900  ORF Transcript_50255/g.108900 Transcript_50255/m.108900 type:complete len:1012 (-) Transcript_50255:422-3457(-)